MRGAAALARWMLAIALALVAFTNDSQAAGPLPGPYYPAAPSYPYVAAGYRPAPPSHQYCPPGQHCPPGSQPSAPSTAPPRTGADGRPQTDTQPGERSTDPARRMDGLFDQQQGQQQQQNQQNQQQQQQNQAASPSTNATASASNSASPNMIGDFFGGAGACQLGRVFIGQAAFHPIGTPFGADDFHLITPGFPPGAPATFAGGAGGADGVAFVGGAPAPGGTVAGLTGFNRPGQTFSAVPTGGTTDVNDPAGPFPPLPVFDIFYDEVICIPSPGSSGVGRVKLSDNGSPLPRSRVFVNYSNFRNVPLTGTPIDVNRYVPGFEETFYGGDMSVEVRIPFATTADSDQISAPSSDAMSTEFGNVSVLWKTKLYSNCSWYFSTGVQITAPTADDVRVFSPNQTLLVDVKNEALHLSPFLGILYTPSERFFAQAFIQADTNIQDNPVAIRNPVTSVLDSAGGLDDTNFLYFDLSLGYWAYRSNNCSPLGLSGLAPIFEVHYNRSLQDPDTVQANGFRVGAMADSIDIVNLVGGLTAEFGQDALVTVGYTVPVTEEPNRDFSGELRVMANLRFGAEGTRAARSPY